MKIYKTENYDKMSEKVASLLAAQIISKPDSVLGLATGSTPEGTYDCLVDWYTRGLLDFSEVKTVNLDEYKGLAPNDPNSYRYFMNEHLFNRVNVDKDNTYVPDGLAADPDQVCSDYEKLIDELGGMDVQLLGMGHNGHIGFNEPCCEFPMSCHCVSLAPRTVEANKKYFKSEDDMPKQAYSMGIGTIMKAKKVFLVVSGEEKAETLSKVLNGPVTPEIPASILKFHPDVTLIADAAALSKS